MNDINDNIKTFHLKNLNLQTAALLLFDKLQDEGFSVVKVVPGIVTLKNVHPEDEKRLNELLKRYGLDIIKDRELILVEEIKQAVIELIHHMNNMNSVVRKSEYIVEKLGKSYSLLSRVFSKHEPLTLEKYIILQKIERIKELIDQDEYTLSEIAYMMDYSSVQYLSNQFKKVTGFSVTDYKNVPEGKKKYLDDIS